MREINEFGEIKTPFEVTLEDLSCEVVVIFSKSKELTLMIQGNIKVDAEKKNKTLKIKGVKKLQNTVNISANSIVADNVIISSNNISIGGNESVSGTYNSKITLRVPNYTDVNYTSVPNWKEIFSKN